MFSYIDPTIRQKLLRAGQIVDLDHRGNPTSGLSGQETPFITLAGPVPLPVCLGENKTLSVLFYPFVRRVELSQVLATARSIKDTSNITELRDLLRSHMSVNSLLVLPGFEKQSCPLVRVHSCCVTGDVFNSKRCECGPQLRASFREISGQGGGAIAYMSGHEGRGIGLWAKAIAYLLQDKGEDTYQANTSLGLPEDSRDFRDAAVVLLHVLGGRSIRLLSNNPAKRSQLEEEGVKVERMVPLVVGINDLNRPYLRSKRKKGHLLPDI